MANKFIPQTNVPQTGVAQGLALYRNPLTGKDEHAPIQEFIGGTRASFAWSASTTYAIDDLVLDSERVWKSLQASNLGNPPTESAFWTEATISPADGITDRDWVAGVFTYNKSKVVFENAQYYLQVPAPFESTDFATELGVGTWAGPVAVQQSFVDFIPQDPAPAHNEGRVYYDDIKKNYVFYNDRTQVSMDLGREFWERGNNDTGVQINNGEIVYIEGYSATKDMPNMDLADGSNIAKSAVIAFATENIIDTEDGEFTRAGRVNDVVTFGFTAGQIIYLSDTVPGGFQANPPLPPSNAVQVGNIAKESSGAGIPDGKIDVRINDIIAPIEITMAANFNSAVGVTGVDNYIKSFYTFESGFTPSGAPNVIGTASVLYGAHVYFVLGAASTDMVIRVTGDSWDETAETIADFELVDTSGGATDAYFQTAKKFNGQASITLESGTGVICDPGLAHYWDNNNKRFILTQVLWTGVAGANDAGPDFQIIHHQSAGWTYSGAGAIPPAPSVDLAALITNNALGSGQPFSFKLSGVSDVIEGDNEQGAVIIANYNLNNSIAYSDIELKILQ